jgi:hypothetical protein
MSIGQVESLARKAAMREQRSEPRKELCVNVAVFPVGEPAIVATSTNVSAHGMDLSSAIELRPATRCEVEFALPIDGQRRLLRIQACVVRSTALTDEFSLGLVFFGMPQRTQELLELFLCTS